MKDCQIIYQPDNNTFGDCKSPKTLILKQHVCEEWPVTQLVDGATSHVV